MAADLAWAKAAGANFVRGCHYPQDARLLDLADAMGLLVWEEVMGWGVKGESLGSKRWLDAQLASLDGKEASLDDLGKFIEQEPESLQAKDSCFGFHRIEGFQILTQNFSSSALISPFSSFCRQNEAFPSHRDFE